MKNATYGNAKKFNDYDLTSLNFGIGYASNGGMFYFDKEDFEKIRCGCWHIDPSTGYVRGIIPPSKKKVYLHRVVTDAKPNETVDHRNHNGIDNQKHNLRKCTRSQNSANMSVRCDNSSGHTGVWFDKSRNKWCAQITANKKRIDLGRFDDFETAVSTRIRAENEHFKEFSYRNSINCDSMMSEKEMGC